MSWQSVGDIESGTDHTPGNQNDPNPPITINANSVATTFHFYSIVFVSSAAAAIPTTEQGASAMGAVALRELPEVRSSGGKLACSKIRSIQVISNESGAKT